MIIDYNLYKIFLAVAQNGSFTKAANGLFITQSAVSQAIAKLETILNTALFVREGRRIFLTKKGKILKEYIEQGDKYFDGAQEMMSKPYRENHIDIACADIYFKSYVLPALKRYMQKNENMTFSINSKSDYKYRISLVESNQCDFAIIEESEKILSENVVCKKFATLHYKLVYNPAYFNINSDMPIEDIFENYHFFVQTLGTRPRSYLESVLDEKFPLLYSEFYHVDSLIDAVEAGVGIGFVPVEFLLDRNLKVLDQLTKSVTVNIIYKPHNEYLIKSLFDIE